MPKINELNINITKAVITSITIEIKEDDIHYNVSGSLMTAENKAVSQFSFMTDHWLDSKKMKVPPSVYLPSKELFKLFTPVIYKQIQGEFTMIGSGEEK